MLAFLLDFFAGLDGDCDASLDDAFFANLAEKIGFIPFAAAIAGDETDEQSLRVQGCERAMAQAKG